MINIENFIITPEILGLIAEIDEFKGAWLELGKLAPDRLFNLKKVATIESIGSSTRIEGAVLSDQEVARLLKCVNESSFQTRDEQEVIGYAKAFEILSDQWEVIPFTENVFKQMHMQMLHYSDKDERHRGEYKKIPIRIEAFDEQGKSVGIIFETTSPLETPLKMRELVLWTQSVLEKKSLHPLLVISLFVVVFLAIHPFQDGNGRLSRLLTTLLMLKCGYHYVPYSSLESVIERNKESYYLALQQTQKSWQHDNPHWTPWVIFFLTCLQRQKNHLEVKVSREKLLLKERPSLSGHIVDLIQAHGQLRISEIEVLTRANRNTLKKTLVSLVRSNQIKLRGKGKGACYTIL